MKITLINTSDTIGGAAVACSRLLKALQQNGISATLLVQEKKGTDRGVISTTNSRIKHYCNFTRFAWELLTFALQEKSRDVRFSFSIANTGEDISKHSILLDSDVLHMHWINKGFLSLHSLEQLFRINKPIVWTLHDMWIFTGGCHYAGECRNYETECHNCPFLKKPAVRDISHRIFQEKLRLFESINPNAITFVTCSQWLAEVARKSRLLKGFNITSIPNPIDTMAFHPIDKVTARSKIGLPLEKKLILFGAGNILDKRKGIQYLSESLKILYGQHRELAEHVELVVFGKSKQPIQSLFSFRTHNLGVVKGEELLANLYSSCDVFVLPSMEDNLPNTVMESLACGTPVVAFRIGGIPEMIDHRVNGYLAEPFSAADFANGVFSLLSTSSSPIVAQNARGKVESTYTMDVIAQRYINLYKSLLQTKV
jgi:glycosyltransferase involved in cell wall biosynthesis